MYAREGIHRIAHVSKELNSYKICWFLVSDSLFLPEKSKKMTFFIKKFSNYLVGIKKNTNFAANIW